MQRTSAVRGAVCCPGSSLDASTDPTAKRRLYFYSSRSENRSGSPGQTDRILPACLHPEFLSHTLRSASLARDLEHNRALPRTGRLRAVSRAGTWPPAHPTPGRLSKPVGSSEIRSCLLRQESVFVVPKPLTTKGQPLCPLRALQVLFAAHAESGSRGRQRGRSVVLLYCRKPAPPARPCGAAAGDRMVAEAVPLLIRWQESTV